MVTLNGQAITLLGKPVYVGEAAPPFKAVANNMTVYHFRPGHGKVWIISSVPALDTPVCSLETRHFNQVASTLDQDVGVLLQADIDGIFYSAFCYKKWPIYSTVGNQQCLTKTRAQYIFARSLSKPYWA
ncbi:MAG: hypothetical protein HKL95_00485 [Phycisphaerae bacterium]|nr:hypothetical protein [Phycisphaerae bacterium]